MTLRMSNLYYFAFAIVITFSLFISSMTKLNIENTLSLINEELILDCVTYKGIIDANEQEDPSYLYLNQDKLKVVVNAILKENLNNLTYLSEFYFYDYTTLDKTYIDKQYCNSVQIKITINYQKQQIINIYRFEPLKRGDYNKK